MLTPAISASRTSAPCIIRANAVSTQVLSPPFLYLWPLPDAMTTGLGRFCVIMVGDAPNAGLAAAAKPAVLVTTNSRREIPSDMAGTPYGSGLRTGSEIVDY